MGRFKFKLRNLVYTLGTPFRRLRNKRLCDRYPFLLYSSPDEPIKWSDYDTTFLDSMPYAWRKDFRKANVRGNKE